MSTLPYGNPLCLTNIYLPSLFLCAFLRTGVCVCVCPRTCASAFGYTPLAFTCVCVFVCVCVCVSSTECCAGSEGGGGGLHHHPPELEHPGSAQRRDHPVQAPGAGRGHSPDEHHLRQGAGTHTPLLYTSTTPPPAQGAPSLRCAVYLKVTRDIPPGDQTVISRFGNLPLMTSQAGVSA